MMGRDLLEVTQYVDAASGLKPTLNKSSFHPATLTRRSTHWFIRQLMCSVPSGRDAVVDLATHSMTSDGFEVFFVLVVQGKARREGEEEH